MANNETENKEKTIEIPAYEISEVFGKSIFHLNLEELIFEKMVVMYEKQMALDKDLFDAEIQLQITKDQLLLETDFAKELNKSRPNQADRDAYMRPYLAEIEDKIDAIKTQITFYKNKIIIINDLIKARRTQLLLDAEKEV